MAAFTFTSPEGKSYTVTGPDGATAAQAFQVLQGQLAQQAEQQARNPANSGTETYLDLGSMSLKQRPASNFVEGMGKAFVDVGSGIKQAALQAGNKLGLVSDQTVAQNQQDVDNRRELDRPLMQTAGGKVGNFAGDAALASAAPEGLLGATGGGAALAAAQPTVTGESRTANTVMGAVGGAAGYGVGKVLGAVAQPIVDQMPALRRQFVQTLAKEGVPLDSAQATGSGVARTLKDAAADAPFGSSPELPQQQAEQFTRAALEKMGVEGKTEASPVVMQAGKQALKDRYNQIAANNAISLDSPLAADIARIRDQANRTLTPDHATVINNQLQDITTMAQRNGGKIDGAAYQNLQSQLDRVAKDGGKAPFVTDIRQALTGAMGRQSSPGWQTLLAQTDQRYAAMKAIEKSIDSNSNQINPSSLYNAIDTARGANQTVYGQGPNQALINLAQAGKAILGNASQTANSGTTKRAAGLGAVGMLGAEAYDLASGKPMNVQDAITGAAALGMAPALASKLIYSPAGRAALTKWASSRYAARAAAAGYRAGQTAGVAAPSAMAGTTQPSQ